DLLGVRYVLAATEMHDVGVPVGPALDGPGGMFRVYERASAMPRAFTVPNVRVIDDPGGAPGPDGQAPVDLAIAAALVVPGFDPRAEVLLTADMAARLTSREPGGAARAVTFEREDPTDVILRVADGARGYLVSNDTFMSGWSATVNGAPVPMVRGDLF